MSVLIKPGYRGRDMSEWTKIVIEVMKASMKPGYLYGVSEDGELYCIEAKMSKPGETLIMPPFHMPKEMFFGNMVCFFLGCLYSDWRRGK